MFFQARQTQLALLVSALLVPGGASYAAALAAPSLSISSLGNANANAASIDDASAQFYNPAALSFLKKHSATISVMVADASIDFENGTSEGTSETIVGVPTNGGDEGDPVKPTPVPAAYYAYPLGNDLTFGLSIAAPYTIAGHFDEDWVGRYDGIESQTIALNINPAISWRPTDNFSVGFGISGQYFSLQRRRAADQVAGAHFLVNTFADDAVISAQNSLGCSSLTDCSGSSVANAQQQLNNIVTTVEDLRGELNTALDGVVGTNQKENDGEVAFEGDDFAFGYNLGLMYQLNRENRFGFAYRSQVKHHIKGDLDWTVTEKAKDAQLSEDAKLNLAILANLGLPDGIELPISGLDTGELVYFLLNDVLFVDSTADARLTTPATASFHSYHQVTPNFSVLTDATWTEWSVIQEIRISIDSLLNDSLTPANLEDTWRLSLATNYRYSPSLMLRAGYAFDQSPVQEEYRSPSLPDSDRQMFSIGALWQLSRTQTLDFAASVITFKDAEVNYHDWAGQDTPPPALGEGGYTGSKHTTRGTFSSRAWLVGLQYNHQF